MKYDFTNASSREKTNAEKYMLKEQKFGTSDVIPAWIADMDLDSPVFVQEALKKRLEHPIFGYEEFPKSALLAQITWLKNNHNISFELKDVFYSHSVTATMNVAIEAFTNESDNIIVQTPVYGPFFSTVKEQNREVLYNPLIKDEDGLYKMDLNSLKKQINNKTKMIMFCNPQNPTGRVWSKNELEELVEICRKHNIIIFSDEVHCDLVYKPYKHIPIATIQGAKNLTLSAYGIGKSFNLSGLACSTVYIQNEELKNTFKKVYEKYHFASGNILSHVAFESAYTNGQKWMEDLKEHLYDNYLLLEEICNKHKLLVKLNPIQSTFLAWIDCSGMNMSDKKVGTFFINDAKLGLNRGIFFGKAGHGYYRLNFAVTTRNMKKIVKKLDEALCRF